METKAIQIEVGATLDIDTVGSLHRQICDAMDHASDLDLDLSAVVNFDTAGMQLLVATALACQKRGLRVSFAGPRAELAAAVASLDLAKFLGAWPVENANHEVCA